MKRNPIFLTSSSFYHLLVGFLIYHRCLDDFERRLACSSVDAFCSRFCKAVDEGAITFDCAISAAFIWGFEDRRWSRLSDKWVKFVKSL